MKQKPKKLVFRPRNYSVMQDKNKRLDRRIAACLAVSLDPSSSDWAKKFWKKTAEKLMKKVDR